MACTVSATRSYLAPVLCRDAMNIPADGFWFDLSQHLGEWKLLHWGRTCPEVIQPVFLRTVCSGQVLLRRVQASSAPEQVLQDQGAGIKLGFPAMWCMQFSGSVGMVEFELWGAKENQRSLHVQAWSYILLCEGVGGTQRLAGSSSLYCPLKFPLCFMHQKHIVPCRLCAT